MLVLTRTPGESVVLMLPDGQRVTVTLLDVQASGKTRIGFEAPDAVRINRLEVQDAIDAGPSH